MSEDMAQVIVEAIVGLRGDFCLGVFCLAALVLGVVLSGSKPAVDSDEPSP